jgi:hypothetical protein
LEPKPKLPPATQEGKGTFGCLLNGKLWHPYESIGTGGDIHAEYQYAKDSIGVNIYASKDKEVIIMSFYDSPTLQVNKIYDLGVAASKFYVQYNNFSKATTCRYEHIVSGTVKLSRFDTSRRIISGTFEFMVTNTTCGDTIKVTDGRFDIGNVLQ